MRFSAAALAAVLLLASAGSAHDFVTCKNQHGDPLGVQSVAFTPDPPQSGKPVSVTVKGVSSVGVEQGATLHVDIRVLGVTVDSQVLEVCDILKCPIAAGQTYEGSVAQEIPAGTPNHMGATVRLSVVSQSGQTLTCLESKVEISGDTNKVHDDALTAPGQMLEKDVEFLFNKWKAQHPKMVANFKVFSANLAKIITHNRKKDQTFTMAMNEFGSMTEEEFAATRMGFREPRQDVQRNGPLAPRITFLRSDVAKADPPAEVDWVAKGLVTQVKNQGSCGSCWAFSAIAAMESAYAIKNGGELIEFSEQELVSCDNTDYGCQGGWMDSAYDWVQKTGGGLCKEADYPYQSGATSARGDCLLTQCTIVPNSAPKGYIDIPPSEAAIVAAVAQHGPVSVGIEADQAAFQFYHSGVLTGTCGTHLNHGVLIVGYGVDETTKTPFWKVKNSWGPGWGESGYVRIQRGKRWPTGGECGIATHASYPVY